MLCVCLHSFVGSFSARSHVSDCLRNFPGSFSTRSFMSGSLRNFANSFYTVLQCFWSWLASSLCFSGCVVRLDTPLLRLITSFSNFSILCVWLSGHIFIVTMGESRLCMCGSAAANGHIVHPHEWIWSIGVDRGNRRPWRKSSRIATLSHPVSLPSSASDCIHRVLEVARRMLCLPG
jgi:hypothetical protein